MNSINTGDQNSSKPDRAPASLVRIRFQDCDPYGHLNNSRYLDYFINAREQHLREHYQLDIYSERFRERGWVVRTSTVTYLWPVRFNQEVRIQTRLLNFSASSIVMEGVMANPEQNRLHATSWVEFTYIDLKAGRPTRHEADLMELFASLQMEPEFILDGGRDRIKKLKRGVAA